MSKLIMTMGLPGSGKSTWAREQAGFHVVEKDGIRKLLESQGWKWSRENEKDVLSHQENVIKTDLLNGRNVIAADTNFGRKHKVRLAALAQECGAEFEIKRFDVPLKTCLERNATREERVPASVIHEMFNTFVVKDPEHFPLSAPPREYEGEKVKRLDGLPSAVICDLDGTLALFENHRGPYDASTCDQDEVNKPINNLLHIYKWDFDIIYLSGREDKFREPTLRFLNKNCCPTGSLHMRPTGDFRKDWIVKRELFDANVRGKFNVEFVLDDRNQVVAMWRSLGLTCLQVAAGAF